MGKYQDRRTEVKVEKDHTKNFVWRGIGCALMIVIPLISIAAASISVTIPAVQYYLPDALLAYPALPEFVFKLTYEMQQLILPITEIEAFYGIVVLSVIYMVILGSLISLLYAVIFRIISPRTYGPYDVPPPNVRAKKYKR